MPTLRLVPLVLALLVLAPAYAEEEPGKGIAWEEDLATAFAKGKATQMVIMVCVNAKHVEGRMTEEPAAKGLREVVYKDPRIVAKSKEFVCAMLKRTGTADDFGELRALGIDGAIVSPQHIFVHPDGKDLLLRKQYWPHGRGEDAVRILLNLMETAQAKLAGKAADTDEPADDVPDAPEDGEERAAWIAETVAKVVSGSAAGVQAAIDALVKNDREGDCIRPLVALFKEHKKSVTLISTIVRALGRDGLEHAALPVADLLKHKHFVVRGNAAVTLEYIGSMEKKVVSALKKAADKEKDAAIANHMYRALGRCGRQDAKIRAHLLKKSEGAKSEYASYGPLIGLAYFEGDEKAMRGVEKILKKIGVPGSRRGGGANVVKRALASWTLACIGDEKSGEFVREELMAGLKNVMAIWVAPLRIFWDGVARVCEGEKDLLSGVEDGVRGAVTFAKRGNIERYGAETRGLMDEYRLEREWAGFTPKGDHILNDERGG